MVSVKEVIEWLSEFNPKADCYVFDYKDIEVGWINKSDKGEYTKETTPVVFIQGYDERYS